MASSSSNSPFFSSSYSSSRRQRRRPLFEESAPSPFFPTVEEACLFAKNYFNERLQENYHVKLQSIKRNNSNIQISLVTKFSIGHDQHLMIHEKAKGVRTTGYGEEKVNVGWIYKHDGLFHIAVDGEYLKFASEVTPSEVLRDMRLTFASSTIQYDRLKIMEEHDYYGEVLKSVDKRSHDRGEHSQWRIHDRDNQPVAGSFLYVPALKEAVGENRRRFHASDVIQNILYQTAKLKLPETIRVNSIKKADGSYKLHAEFDDGKFVKPLKMEDLIDDNAEAPGLYPHVDSIAGTKESTMSTEGLGEMLLFREKAISGFYPASPDHPRFPQLSSTSQKLIRMQFEHQEGRNKVNRKVKKIIRNM